MPTARWERDIKRKAQTRQYYQDRWAFVEDTNGKYSFQDAGDSRRRGGEATANRPWNKVTLPKLNWTKPR